MKTYERELVMSELRDRGFHPMGRGCASGHAVWEDRRSRRCRPSFCKRDIPEAYLYSLGKELENQGVCTRREFVTSLKRRRRG
jgi:hypothetical protein